MQGALPDSHECDVCLTHLPVEEVVPDRAGGALGRGVPTEVLELLCGTKRKKNQCLGTRNRRKFDDGTAPILLPRETMIECTIFGFKERILSRA